MGLFSRIRGRSKRSGTQADKPESKRTLLKEYVEATAELARVKVLPVSAFQPRTASGYIITHSVDRKDNAIAYAQADVAELKAKIKGSDLVLVDRKRTRMNTKSAPNSPPLETNNEG